MPPTETEKQELHSLLDRVPPSELDIVKRFLELIAKANHEWPIDDEPETPEERTAVERARQSPRELDTDHEDFRSELGL